MQGYLEAHDAEGLAAFYAVQLSKETGVTNLILEGDAKSIRDGHSECKELKKQSDSSESRRCFLIVSEGRKEWFSRAPIWFLGKSSLVFCNEPSMRPSGSSGSHS
jgi:hypothetical protein